MNMPFETLSASGPLYRVVQRQMLDALARGEWRPDEAIPSEKRLCERFGVSIGTLRKAIDGLVADHILVRQQGLGTFVASHSRQRHFFQFFSLASHEGAKTYPEVRFIQFAQGKADKLCAEKLGIAVGAEIFKIKNLLVIDGAAVSIDHISLPAQLFANLSEAIIRNRPNTLYNLYLDSFGVNVIRIDERVRAASVPAVSAKLLDMAPGDPMLEVRRVAYSFNRQPVEWRVSHINTARHEYVHADAHDA